MVEWEFSKPDKSWLPFKKNYEEFGREIVSMGSWGCCIFPRSNRNFDVETCMLQMRMCQAELSAHVSVPTSVPRVLDMKNVMLKSKNKDGGQIFQNFRNRKIDYKLH